MTKVELKCPKCDSETQIFEVHVGVESLTFKSFCTEPDCGMLASHTCPYEDLAIYAHCREHNRPVIPHPVSRFKH